MPYLAPGELARDLVGPLRGRAAASAWAWASDRGSSAGCDAASGWLAAPVATVLARRRSVRTFDARPLTHDVLREVVQSALRAERQTWPATAHGAGYLSVAVAAFDVDGLAPGIHTFDADHDTFAAVPTTGDVRTLQLTYAPAPALLFVLGDVQRAASGGPSGYASALVRAGTLGYAALLSGISMGLAGCPYGGASQLVTDAVWPRLHRQHLFTVSLGLEPTPVGQSTESSHD